MTNWDGIEPGDSIEWADSKGRLHVAEVTRIDLGENLRWEYRVDLLSGIQGLVFEVQVRRRFPFRSEPYSLDEALVVLSD